MTETTATLLGLRVEEQLRKQALSIPRLAKDAGLALNIVQRVCKGHGKRVSAWTVKALASALHVSTDYLLGLTDRP